MKNTPKNYQHPLQILGLNTMLAMLAGIAMMAIGIYYQFKQLQKR